MKPDYGTYTLDELIDARRSINTAQFPERAAELDGRIAGYKSLGRPAVEGYPSEFRTTVPELSDDDSTFYGPTQITFTGIHRVLFKAARCAEVVVDRERRIVTCEPELELSFNGIAAITVTRIRRGGDEPWPDDVGVWIKPQDARAVRVAKLRSVPVANKLAQYIGVFTGATKVQVL